MLRKTIIARVPNYSTTDYFIAPNDNKTLRGNKDRTNILDSQKRWLIF